MKQIITAKLKLITTDEQTKAFRRTQLSYRDALNFASKYAFDNGIISNAIDLQKATYSAIREKFNIPAQMACNIPRQVAGTYKFLKTKQKKHEENLRKKYTKKKFRGLNKPAKYIAPTVTYSYGRDFSFCHESQISIRTLDGRIRCEYRGYSKHVDLLKNKATIGAAKLYYDKSSKVFYLMIALEFEIADPTPESHKTIVGVDVGQRYIAVATDMRDRSCFAKGGADRVNAVHYTRLRKELQQKGTRSATRKLINISKRERRFKLDLNHRVSKAIISRYPNSVIGLERLTDIRERTKTRGKSKKAKKVRHNKSRWSFAELQALIAYKAVLDGSLPIKVHADYTSQMCPKCGHTCKENRRGLSFACKNCGYQLHADLIGARNIAMRTLLVRQDWARTGRLSAAPNVSGNEAKAECLRRYSEMRWSPETNLCP
jgi:putative transposase